MKYRSKYGFVTEESRSWLMSRIKSKNTRPEVNLRKELWKFGLRFRKNDKRLPGKPDIVFTKKEIVIFIDGEFWHGFNWEEKKYKIQNNKEYWIEKIESNIARDKSINKMYKKMNWTILRFWEHEIKENMNSCILRITDTLNK